jgi:hypothetical protein
MALFRSLKRRSSATRDITCCRLLVGGGVVVVGGEAAGFNVGGDLVVVFREKIIRDFYNLGVKLLLLASCC